MGQPEPPDSRVRHLRPLHGHAGRPSAVRGQRRDADGELRGRRSGAPQTGHVGHHAAAVNELWIEKENKKKTPHTKLKPRFYRL